MESVEPSARSSARTTPSKAVTMSDPLQFARLCFAAWLTLALVPMIGCAASRNAEELRAISADSAKVAVIRDKTKAYWAVRGSAIVSVEKGAVRIGPGGPVTKCSSGEGDSADLAKALIQSNRNESGSFQARFKSGDTNGKKWSLDGCATGLAEQEMVIQIDELLDIE